MELMELIAGKALLSEGCSWKATLIKQINRVCSFISRMRSRWLLKERFLLLIERPYESVRASTSEYESVIWISRINNFIAIKRYK